MHPHESLIRTHVEGEGSERERQEIAEHLKDCGDCREFLSFVQDFSGTAKDLAEDEIAADEPHAPKSVIIAYEDGKLDAETALHLRAHMLFCDECAETYYLLKRMRAPSWVEVVIGVVQRAKDTLLEALEITGMGELVPAPATATRGEPAQPHLEITQHIGDSDGEADLHLSLEPNVSKPGVVCVRALIDPSQIWTATLLDARDRVLASIPLGAEPQVLHSGLALGLFVLRINKEEDVIAECRLKIQASR